MVREVLSVNVGQCGVQLGHRIWKQYLVEHGIESDGRRGRRPDRDTAFTCFFKETNDGRYSPRNLMVDLDPVCIDRHVKSSPFSNIYESEFLVSGLENAAHNFARGHYTIGKEVIGKVNDRLRKLFDECDNVQGFVINHSVGGGTGSGLGALILERIAVDYRKKSKFGFEVYPSDDYKRNAVVSPYNAMLCTHWLLDHTAVSLVFDNQKLRQICSEISNIRAPSFDNLNALISKVVSSMTASLRYEGEMNEGEMKMQTGQMVPFPRLHFMTPTMAPIINKKTLRDNKKIFVDGFVRNNLQNTESDLKEEHSSDEKEEITVTVNGKQKIWDPYQIQKDLSQLSIGQLRLQCYVDKLPCMRQPWNLFVSAMIAQYRREYEKKAFLASEKRRIRTTKLRRARAQNYIFNGQPPLYQDIMNTLYNVYNIENIDIGVYEMTQEAFNQCNSMVDIPNFDRETDRYMSVGVNYRGSVKSMEANACVWQIKQDREVVFVEWCPTGFSVGLNEVAIPMLENDFIACSDKSLVTIGNNTGISRFFSKRISKPYDLMYSQRAFVHWYVAEGMEEGEFAEAREDLGFLEKDYLDVLSECATTDEEEDESE